MRKPVEVIQGDKSLRLSLYLIIASYILLILLIEPALDFILLSLFEQNNVYEIDKINRIKQVVSALLYTVIGFIPASYASWFGYRIIASAKIPPILSSAKPRFPFTVIVIKGKPAKMFGVLIIVVSLVLIFQLILHLVNVLLL